MHEIEAQTLCIFVYKSHRFSNIFLHSKSKHCVFIPVYIYTHIRLFGLYWSTTRKHTAQLRKLLKAQEGAGTLCDLFKSCSSDSLTDQFSFYGNTYVWEC